MWAISHLLFIQRSSEESIYSSVLQSLPHSQLSPEMDLTWHTPPEIQCLSMTCVAFKIVLVVLRAWVHIARLRCGKIKELMEEMGTDTQLQGRPDWLTIIYAQLLARWSKQWLTSGVMWVLNTLKQKHAFIHNILKSEQIWKHSKQPE